MLQKTLLITISAQPAANDKTFLKVITERSHKAVDDAIDVK